MSVAGLANGGPPAPARIRVLVADDNPTNVFILTAMLRPLGLLVISAADGLEAVQIATQKFPRLIFMDLQMPRMDGITAAKKIRAFMSDRRAVIVAVTAFSEVRQVPEFETAEFDDFLVKPLELPVVRRTRRKVAARAKPELSESRGFP